MNVRAIAARFGLEVIDVEPERFGSGLINESWIVWAKDGAYIVQRLNRTVFPDPVAVAENAAMVAAAVSNGLAAEGITGPFTSLEFCHAMGLPWIRDDQGEVWRAMVMILGSCSTRPDRLLELRGAARIVGRFPGLVTAGNTPPPRTLLPGFHDTAAHLARLRSTADGDACNRRDGCSDVLDRLLGLAPLAHRLPDDLPQRVVHNDAKLDNVLVDSETGRAICLVDLDTVQLGLAAHDFGDLVRSAVTGRPEDEPDLSLVTVDHKRFQTLAEGHLYGSATWITLAERASLVDGVLVMTYEQAVRFLADHLAGDVYYAVDEPGHNLRRARAQLKLLEELLVSEGDLRRSL